MYLSPWNHKINIIWFHIPEYLAYFLLAAWVCFGIWWFPECLFECMVVSKCFKHVALACHYLEKVSHVPQFVWMLMMVEYLAMKYWILPWNHWIIPSNSWITCVLLWKSFHQRVWHVRGDFRWFATWSRATGWCSFRRANFGVEWQGKGWSRRFWMIVPLDLYNKFLWMMKVVEKPSNNK